MDTDLAEEWRDIPGFPSYQVSNLGRVMRTKPTTRAVAGYIKAQWLERGIPLTMLHENNTRHKRYIHLLVRSAFGE